MPLSVVILRRAWPLVPRWRAKVEHDEIEEVRCKTIASAIATASRSLRNLEWFEVVSVRGKISDNKVVNYQVTLKLGLLYEPKSEQSDSDRAAEPTRPTSV